MTLADCSRRMNKNIFRFRCNYTYSSLLNDVSQLSVAHIIGFPSISSNENRILLLRIFLTCRKKQRATKANDFKWNRIHIHINISDISESKTISGN